MIDRLRDVSRLLRSTLTPEQHKTVVRLGRWSMVVLVGLAVTGAWQMFAHAPDPAWYGHVGSEFRPGPTPSTGIGALHRFFGGAAVVLALFGGAWFTYKVVHRVPWLAVAVFLVGVASVLTGTWLRFNVVKLSGRPVEDAGRGYFQLFLNEVDFVITDTGDFGAWGIRLLALAHVVSVPVLLVAAWFSFTRGGRPDDFASTRKRKPELTPRHDW